MTGTIRPAKLSDAIAEHLEALILDGVLRPGEKLLPERDLALKLDVSRPSLRDALAKLEERGLLVTGRGGTHVARFLSGITDPLAAILHAHPETTFDYFEFRAALEGLAAGLAAERSNDLDREAIRAIAAPYALRFQLEPGVQASLARDRRSILLRGPSGRGWWFRSDGPDVAIEPAVHIDEGLTRRSLQIVVRGSARTDAETKVRWKLSPAGASGDPH